MNMKYNMYEICLVEYIYYNIRVVCLNPRSNWQTTKSVLYSIIMSHRVMQAIYSFPGCPCFFAQHSYDIPFEGILNVH